MSGYSLEIGDTLALVNLVREKFGHPMLTELPNATMGSPADCVYYRALSPLGVRGVTGSSVEFETERTAAWVAETWGKEASGTTVPLPSSFSDVIQSFDTGGLPQYAFRSEE